MSFLSDGLDWFQDYRHTHCTETISIGFTAGTAYSMKATVAEDDATSTQDRLVQQKQIFHFVVKRADLIASGFKLSRGLKIWRGDDVYELLYNAKSIHEYNDPLRNDVILKAVLVEDSNGISPTYNAS